MKILFTLIALLFSIYSTAQNLFPNPSFEITNSTYCNTNTVGAYGVITGYYPLSSGWNNAGNFDTLVGGTSSDHNCNPDYSILFDILGSAHSGNYVIGMGGGAVTPLYTLTEGITATLNTPVNAGDVLNFSIWFKYSSSFSQNIPNSSQTPFGLFFHSSQATTSGDGGNIVETPHHVINLSGVNASTWTNYTATITVPINATKITIGSFLIAPLASSPFGYIAIDDISLTVNNPCMTSPATASALVPDQITCTSPNVTINGSGGGTYSWSGPGIVGANNTQNISVNAGGSYNLIVTAANGCTATTNVNVSANNTPPSPSASAGGVITCSSPNVTLTGGGGGTYSWSGPSIVSGAGSANPVVNAGGTYNLTVTDGSNGCTANTSVNVTQDITPPSVSASGGGALICSMPNLTLSGSSGSSVSYSWSGPGIVSGAGSANPVVNQPGTYNLTVTDLSNGCTANTSVNVTQDANSPSVSASGGGVLTCSTLNLTLSGSSGSSVSYNWSGPGIVSGGTSANPVVNQPGTYNLTVTDLSNSCTANTSVNVTQDITPPSVSASGGGALTCSTLNLTLSGSSGSSVSYNWSGPGIVSGGTSANPVINQPGTYNLTVTDLSNSCSANTSVNVTQDITPPSPTASVSGSLTCSTTTVSLAGGPTSGVTYTWSGPGLIGGVNGQNAVANASGTYTLTVTNSSNGCTNSAFTTVTLNSTLVLTLSASSSSVCEGNSATITPNGANTYTLVNDGSSIFTNVVVTPTATTVYTISGTNSFGCSATQTVLINYNLLPILSMSATNTTICSGETVVLTASGADSYNWVGGPGTASYNVSPNSTTVYTVVGTNTTTTCQSANTTVTVTVNQTPTVIAAAMSATTCSNGTIVLNASSTPPVTLYSWSGSGITSANQYQSSPSFSAPAVGIYVYNLTGAVASCTSAVSSVTITVADPPSSALTTPSIVICQGTTDFASVASPQSGVTYHWNINGGNTGQGVTYLIPSAIAGIPGIYSISVNAVLGTGSSTCATTSGGTVVVNPTAQVYTDSLLTACIGDNPILSVTNPQTSVMYVWSNSNTQVASGLSYTIKNVQENQAGIYSVLITNLFGCRDSSTVNLMVTKCGLDIPEIFSPNADGRNDKFEIKRISGYPNNKLSVFNRWGSLIYQKNGYNNEWDGTPNVSESTGSGLLPVGTYYVVFEYGDGTTKPYTGFVQLEY